MASSMIPSLERWRVRQKSGAEAPGACHLPRLCRVYRFQRENHDTFTVELKEARGRSAFRFAPGQFNMLYAFGAGEVPVSISGHPEEMEKCAHTIRSVGAVTRLLGSLKSGEYVGLRGPFGIGWPTTSALGRDLLWVAGGVGLAPLRSAIYHALSHRAAYRRLILVYGARSPSDLIFKNDLMKWGSVRDFTMEITVDAAASGWSGHVGVVPGLLRHLGIDAGETVAMLCGPEIMMKYSIGELRGLGVPASRIHVSLERNMKCATGFCGHCQYGPKFICKDGAVFSFDRINDLFFRREL